MPSSTKLMISVGARQSLLSQAQVKEVHKELKRIHKSVLFSCLFVETTGDKDQITSLRTMEKTDFFTRELDQLLLQEKCRIAIHSAKDLPELLAKGLKIAAITKGVDPSDVLVMRPGDTLETLPKNATIATSSVRREEIVKQLRPDFKFIDLRGPISKRLAKLDTGEADGIVVAEAALIRLRMKELNRFFLPGPVAPYQGQLAIVVREDDNEMIELFACLDVR